MNNNFIMTNGTINGMEVFADTIKTAMELGYGDDVKVTVHTVRKNNGVTLTGVIILKDGSNISPIDLEAFGVVRSQEAEVVFPTIKETITQVKYIRE